MRFQNPRYTGAARCWPCTVLNGGLVLLGTLALAAVGRPAVALGVLVVGTGAIWLRGYLVPGTPRIAEHLPASVRARFGKSDPVTSLPPTELLVESGVLTPDLELSDAAASSILDRARTLVESRETLEAAVESTVPAVVETDVTRGLGGGENWFALDADEVAVREWEARPVAALDVAAMEYLAETVAGWADLTASERRELLALVRYGTPACPACGEAFTELDGPRVACCGGRSLVGERRCDACDYQLVDRNDLPTGTDEPTAVEESGHAAASSSGVQW